MAHPMQHYGDREPKMNDMPNKDEVLADLPEREHVYDMDELENLAVAYDMRLLQTKAEWEATIDYEAAAKVDYGQRGRVVGVTPVEWEDVREELKERYRKRAKATVDAAVGEEQT